MELLRRALCTCWCCPTLFSPPTQLYRRVPRDEQQHDDIDEEDSDYDDDDTMTDNTEDNALTSIALDTLRPNERAPPSKFSKKQQQRSHNGAAFPVAPPAAGPSADASLASLSSFLSGTPTKSSGLKMNTSPQSVSEHYYSARRAADSVRAAAKSDDDESTDEFVYLENEFDIEQFYKQQPPHNYSAAALAAAMSRRAMNDRRAADVEENADNRARRLLQESDADLETLAHDVEGI